MNVVLSLRNLTIFMHQVNSCQIIIIVILLLYNCRSLSFPSSDFNENNNNPIYILPFAELQRCYISAVETLLAIEMLLAYIICFVYDITNHVFVQCLLLFCQYF